MIKWRKVEDLLIYSGKGITPKYVEESSIIVLNQKCIRNHKIDYTFSRFTNDTKTINPDKFIQKGDILFNSTGQGTAGRCAFVDWLPEKKKVITDSHILVLRIENYFEAQCLSYSFHSKEKEIMSFMDGSTGQGELDKIRVFNLLTSLSENSKTQKQIAKVLSYLDAKIKINNKINQELEAMAKTLYDYWFVQFDFPDKNEKPYKSSGGKMVFNEELKREIPDGWKSGYLNDLYDFKYGLGNTNPHNGGEYPVYGSNGVIGSYDKFNNEDAPVIGHIGNKCGSLVYAFGKHYVTYNGVMCKIRKPYDKFFGYTTLLSKDLMSRRRGSSQPFISYDLLNDITFIIPEDRIMKIYCALIIPSYEKVISNLKQNQKLSELRDWLLPMLMNGQVSVGYAEKEVDSLGLVAEEGVEYEKN